MKAVFLVTLLLIPSTGVLGQSNNASGNPVRVQQVSVPRGQSSLSGCLQGKPHNYRLTEMDGTTYLLMGESDALSSHVDHVVQLIGYRDNDRDAGASLMKAHRMGRASFASKTLLPISEDANRTIRDISPGERSCDRWVSPQF